ncbi:MAG: LytR/AlgR family response regulator transcription factor [Flavobacteriales bacterium]
MNQSHKILIVEDELLIAENLRFMIGEMYPMSQTEIASGAAEALEKIKNFSPEIAFLDIRLGGGEDGISLAERLSNCSVPFLFLTAHGDTKTVSRAIATQPLGYMIKPVSRPELYANLELAFSRIANVRYYKFRDGTHDVRIPETEIIYLKSDQHYTELYSEKKRYVIRKSLKTVVSELGLPLIQTHRAYFVNPLFIREANATIHLLSGEEIPLSRNFKPGVLDLLFNA